MFKFVKILKYMYVKDNFLYIKFIRYHFQSNLNNCGFYLLIVLYCGNKKNIPVCWALKLSVNWKIIHN